MSLEEKSIAASLNGISKSLLPLIFRNFDNEGIPRKSNFIIDNLTRSASVICKLSGLLIQAYWILLKTKGNNKRISGEYEIPRQLNDILLQLWAGHQKYTDSFAISIIHEASVVPDTFIIGKLANNPEVFIKWARLISCRKGHYKQFLKELRSENWHDQYIKLIEALPILTKIRYEDNKFIFDEFHDVAIPEFPFLKLSSQISSPLYLSSFENDQYKPQISFEDPYNSGYHEEYDLADKTVEKQRYLYIRELLGFENIHEGIVHLFGSGYKHIKNLALSISDVSPNTPKARALARIINEYKDMEECNKIDVKNNPEDFITLILAEHGPTKIVDDLLKNDLLLLDDYLKYLEDRGEGKSTQWKHNMNSHINKSKKSVQEYLALDKDMRKQFLKNIEREAHIWCLLTAAGFEIEKPHSYVESIDLQINMLDNWMSRYANNKNKTELILNINKIIERTFKFLIIFYDGLAHFHYSMNNSESKTNNNEFEESMIEAGKKKYNEIKLMSAGALINYFRDNILTNVNGEVLETHLGRNNICSVKKFSKIANNQWLKIFNKIKHDKKIEVSNDEMDDFLYTTKKLFRYLRSGTEREIMDYKGYALEPIYPLVISFREVHRKRDGMLVHGYEIFSIGERKGFDIKILISRNYLPSEEYYCIPCFDKSSENWWLDPFLIPCSKIDSIFEN